ncbi:hypothetical protein C0992_012714 [Termitomyces sp. T32_za158]|nr:hypothetical protein C0992_012714 [Termitomyces sp. T32_za158]
MERMTRTCRAQFEHDDVDEANLVCTSQGALEDIQTGQHNPNDPSPIMPCSQLRQPSTLSWRLPKWINFLSAAARPHHPRYRPPNSFRPQNSEFSRFKTIHHDSETLRITPSSEPFREIGTDYPPTDTSSLVVKHPPPVPWDDETTVDLPYDNPFYTRELNNVLWLPRDPFGILDLDDTVDLRVSLSVDVATGQLGSWSNLNESMSNPEPTPDKYSPGLSKKQSTGSSWPINGTENIELPPAIARRVECKGDMESTLRSWRPSTSRRKSIGATSASFEGGILKGPPAIIGDSLPEDIRGLGQGRTSSIFAVAESQPYISV